MGQNTALSRDIVFQHIFFHGIQKAFGADGVIFYGVDTDNGIADAVGKTFAHGSQNTVDIIGGMVGLQTDGQAAFFPDGGTAMGGYSQFLRGQNEVHVGHQFGNGGDHFGSETAADAAEFGAGHIDIENVFAEVFHRPVFDFVIDGLIDIIDDDAGDFVFFVRDHRVVVKIFQCHLAEDNLCGDSFFNAPCGNSGQRIAGFFFICFG